jgi:hypothetical protein
VRVAVGNSYGVAITLRAIAQAVQACFCPYVADVYANKLAIVKPFTGSISRLGTEEADGR